ncbi:hypothetical protein [Microbacterium aurum]
MQPVDVVKQIATRRHSPYTELHWVPRVPGHTPGGPSVRQHHAVAGRDVGERDWASIDPMLVDIGPD